MAAAVVPSRTRARAQPPPEPPITYIRMQLRLSQLSGTTIQSATYSAFWDCSTTPTSQTPFVSPSAPLGKLTHYARVKRTGNTYSSHDSPPLQTTILIKQSSPANTITSLPFDIAAHLKHFVRSGSQTISHTLAFPNGMRLPLAISVKALGENHLDGSPPEMDEATAAIELEKLRADVREREGRLDDISEKTGRLELKVSEASTSHSALKQRVQELEAIKEEAEREKIEAERKVAAHVAHAAKIKATYNQLAAWYNNLRKEHAELQELHPGSSSKVKGLPDDVRTTHEEDFAVLQKELEDLKQVLDTEKNEKTQIQRSASDLVAHAGVNGGLPEVLVVLDKLRADVDEKVADLDSLNASLEDTSRARAEAERDLSSARAELDTVRNAFEDKIATIREEQVAESAKRRDHISKLKADHDRAIADLRTEIINAATLHSAAMAELDTRHEEHVREADEAAKVAKDQLEHMRSQLQSAETTAVSREAEVLTRSASVDKEVLELRLEVSALQERNEAIQTSQDEKAATQQELEAEVSALHTQLRVESEKRGEVVQMLESSDQEHDELRIMVSRLRAERDEALEQVRNARPQGKDSRSEAGPVDPVLEMESLAEERDKAIRELFRVRKSLNKDIRRLKKENEDLTTGTDVAKSIETVPSEQMIAVQGERDDAMKDLTVVREKLGAIEEEVAAHKAETVALQNTLSSTSDEHGAVKARLEQEQAELKKELEAVEEKVVSLTAEIQRRDEKVTSLSESLQSTKRDVGKAEERGQQLLTERDEIQNRSTALVTELNSLKEAFEAASSSTSSTELLLRDAQRDIAESKAEISLLKSSVQSAEQAVREKDVKHKGELSALEAKLSEVSQSAASFETEVRHLQSTIIEREKDRDAVQVARDGAVSEKSQLETEIRSLQVSVASLTDSIAAEKQAKDEVETRLASASEKLTALKQQVSDVEKSNSRYETEARQMSSNATSLQQQISTANKELESLQAEFSARGSKLTTVQEQLKASEASREVLETQLNASGGESEAIVREMDSLRKELSQRRSELSIATQALEKESAAVSVAKQGEKLASEKLQTTSEEFQARYAALESNYDTTSSELTEVKRVSKELLAQLREAEEMTVVLEAEAETKEVKFTELTSLLSKMSTANEQSSLEYDDLLAKHQELKHELAEVRDEARTQDAIATKTKQKLEKKLRSMENELASMQEESENAVNEERIRVEKEMKKSVGVGKELESSRSKLDELQSEYKEVKEREANHLTDLINTRLELAYAREETVRLRNKLKKNSQGNSSFEL